MEATGAALFTVTVRLFWFLMLGINKVLDRRILQSFLYSHAKVRQSPVFYCKNIVLLPI